jgi:hypothetical protein
LPKNKRTEVCLTTSPQTPSPPSLIVQVVDPVWVPLPGASVSISAKGQNCKAYTDLEGNAKFWLGENTEYKAEAELIGFKKKRLKHLYIFPSSNPFHTAHIQIKLDVAGRAIIIE